MNQLKINIKTKNLELNPELRSHIEAKVNSLQKVMSSAREHEVIVDVELEKQFGEHHNKGEVYRAEINLTLEGKLHRGEVTDFDIKIAVNKAIKELNKQIRRSKERRGDLLKRGGKTVKKWVKFGRK